MNIKRWMYRGGRPDDLTRLINKGWAIFHAWGLFPDYMVTLEVVGRTSGKLIRFPLVLTVYEGERYLVSMLGKETNWIRNVRAAGWKATLRHGKVEQVVLEEVEASQRAPILKAYLQIAPGARPHVMINKDAPLADFEKITADYPVFKLNIRE